MKRFILTATLCWLPGVLVVLMAQSSPFVSIDGGRFVRHGEPYHFLGSNLWYGMQLGDPRASEGRNRLLRELDRLQELGIRNLRIMAASEGPVGAPWRVHPALQQAPGQWEDTLLLGLDFLLTEMAKRNMTAVLCLNNFFQWTGGMAQYVSWATETPIPYPHDPAHTWDEFQTYATRFFVNRKAQRMFQETIRTLVERRNTVTGIAYAQDPTIMAWQLANEPRGFARSKPYARWVHRTARLLHRLAPQHLVSIGGEGYLKPENGTRFEQTSRSRYVDYLTCHIWVENWSWYDPQRPEETFDSAMTTAQAYLARHVQLAQRLQKPLVLEEFGISRDQGIRDVSSTTQWRDRYFQAMFDILVQHAEDTPVMAGANFWSWAGEARPVHVGGAWQIGDPFIGDPPHEEQGWYSVYDQDASTLEVIRTFAQKMQQVGRGR